MPLVHGFLTRCEVRDNVFEEHERAWCELFEEEAVETKVRVAPGLASAVHHFEAEDQGPTFRCDMLCGCTCDDPCDWHAALRTAQPLQSYVVGAPVYCMPEDVAFADRAGQAWRKWGRLR